MDWTQERVDLVKSLWLEGKSATQIAMALDCGATRNMVIGKVHRLKLSRSSKPRITSTAPRSPRKATEPRPAAFVMRLATTRAVRLKIVPKPARKSTVGILDVRGCKWAIGEDDAVIGRHTFCNDETAEGSSYCAEHRQENVASYSRDLISKTIKSAIKANKPRAA